MNIKISAERVIQIRDTVRISWRTLKLVWSIDKALFSVAFISTILPAIIPFINIYIYKLIIDMVVVAAAGGAFESGNFYSLIALRIVTYFVQDGAFRGQEFVDRLLWTKVPIYINQMFFKKLSTLDVYYFEDSDFRNLLERARESYDHRPQNLISSLFYGMQSFVQFGIAFVALAQLNWLFIILILFVTIPEFINQTLQSKVSWGIWQHNSAFRKRHGYLTHILQGPREFKEVKLFQLANKFINEMKEIQTKFYADNKKLAVRSLRTGLFFNSFSTVAFIGIEIYVIVQALSRKVTVGDISFYTGVVSNFQNGLGGLFKNINQIFDNSLYVKNVFDVLDAKSLLEQGKNQIVLDTKKAPKIEFKNVDFAYPGSAKKILKNFSLIINPGEKIALVGENGAGKSTIIKLLARFYDVDAGEILINDVNIKDLSLDSWYKHIGILLQDFNRYEDSAGENIFYGKVDQEYDLPKIIESSVSAGAHPFIKNFEKGYEQIFGKMFEGGIELSGGQWQKIALARAFFRDAPILVLDEPTASIDAKSESEIFNRVEKLSKDKTVIIISHRFSTVRNADQIYVIENGKIIESGSHEALIGLKGEYEKMFKLQAKGYQ